jgi:hypothetical protein
MRSHHYENQIFHDYFGTRLDTQIDSCPHQRIAYWLACEAGA